MKQTKMSQKVSQKVKIKMKKRNKRNPRLLQAIKLFQRVPRSV